MLLRRSRNINDINGSGSMQNTAQNAEDSQNEMRSAEYSIWNDETFDHNGIGIELDNKIDECEKEDKQTTLTY